MRTLPLAVATWPFGLEGVRRASEVLSSKGPALDAVEEGIRAVESLGIRSVGLSGLPNAEGKVELDAAIVDGSGRCGAVASVQGVEHPISLARKVMELTPHALIVGEGAEKFARAVGMWREARISEASRTEWEKASKELKQDAQPPSPWYWARAYESLNDLHDTVGLVAQDIDGDLAAGASTSGLAFKMPGRVGDSPLVGAGVFARNHRGAAAATGIGEIAIRHALAALAVQLMETLPAQDALEEALLQVRRQEGKESLEISLVGIDGKGNYGAATLRKSFPYAVWDGHDVRMKEQLGLRDPTQRLYSPDASSTS